MEADLQVLKTLPITEISKFFSINCLLNLIIFLINLQLGLKDTPNFPYSCPPVRKWASLGM